MERLPRIPDGETVSTQDLRSLRARGRRLYRKARNPTRVAFLHRLVSAIDKGRSAEDSPRTYSAVDRGPNCEIRLTPDPTYSVWKYMQNK